MRSSRGTAGGGGTALSRQSSPSSSVADSASSEWILMSSRTRERKEKKMEKAVLTGWKIRTQKEREIFEAYLESTDLKKLRVPIDRLFERAVPSATSSALSRSFDRYMTGPEGKWLEEVRKVAKLESIKYCDYGKERFIVLLAPSSVSLEDGRLCLEAHASYYDVHNQMAELERKDPRLKPSESEK
ncbi:hypothetical protein FOZ60_001779 [Perkinsus olseni]|uniref:Uncharacterized protein n=1 Tax=Perkinsus olseni TaxID=32597 RepID=A0A7J6RQB1_PEROL|nr:hypothetical protein FOZ60_001779 [Perkinsus olseni]KAF4722733.1 hypothetical protein FOZ62_010119 [Perkinsus olseni]